MEEDDFDQAAYDAACSYDARDAEEAAWVNAPHISLTEITAAVVVEQIKTARAVLTYREEAAAEWVDEARRSLKALEARWVDALREWAKGELVTLDTINLSKKKRKSITLHSGTLAFRNKPGRFVVTLPELALTWAKTNLPAAVKVEERLLTDLVSRHAKASGEIPDGMEWQQPEENGSFSIT
ncbi:MAG: hypothetical protein EI684_06010 [Candidatus Viridilinea halotolerans]|uniref:Uncharacterized protein n=1 Tax=Candidatus Viridilinea halotolerans TaxID=2491704 RepID=A0A426U4R7_9CHLR|nr:MAG: hypothetical protein EI684_06010 [Candidatus Viridilinea halotolerans]